MAWSDIVTWVGVKAAGLKILGADFNLLNDNLKKTYDNTVYLKGAFDVPIIGQSLKMLNAYVPISASHPWLCMSRADQTLTTANFSAEFIAEMRSRKIVYDELNTNVSGFGGTWSGNVFTLTNNTANNAMIAELAEDWLFAGSPTANWRILSDGTNEFNITGITVAARQITVNLDSKTASGSSISIYLYRVYGSTTSCRHFSWEGLGLYMTGQNKITGLRRRDKFQRHAHAMIVQSGQADRQVSTSTYLAGQISGATGNYMWRASYDTQNDVSIINPIANGGYGTPRSEFKTEIESGTAMLYLYVGAYTV